MKDMSERKPYPTREDRIFKADEDILRQERLNSERRSLIEKTEIILNQRKKNLLNGERTLDAIKMRRLRLINLTDKHTPKSAEEKAQYRQVLSYLKANGMTVDELIQKLQN